MSRASSCPSSGATTTAVAASGLPLELGDSSDVGRGRAGRLIQLKLKSEILNIFRKILIYNIKYSEFTFGRHIEFLNNNER
jgi:hypothetical protein